MSTFKASIVIPLFNEEANIDHLIKMLVNTNAFKINYCQLVLVNNGSKDKTGELIDYHHKQYPAQIKCIHIKDNINYGGGMLEGLKNSDGEILCMIPGDLQYDGTAIDNVITAAMQQLEKGNHKFFIKGNRTKRMDSLSFQFVSYTYSFIARLFLNIAAKDINGLPKAFDKSLLTLLPLQCMKSFVFDAQLLAIAHKFGYPLEEVSVTFHARRAGVSSWSGRRIRTYFRSLWDLCQVRRAL